MATVQIFLSSVSAEFRSYRDALRRNLDRPNVTVKTQEDFIATGTETLDKLDAYITQCDAVIHLVGDMTGALAQPPSVAAIRTRYPDFDQRLPVLGAFLQADGPALSYTQWEAWLALYHGKVLIIAVPEVGTPRDAHYRDDVQHTAQQEHLARLASVERYPEIRFTNADRLALDVLRSSLQDIFVSAGLLTDEEVEKRAAERRWEYVQTHPITGIKVLLLLKTSVGYVWFCDLLNDTSLSFSRKKRLFTLGQLLKKSTAPNTIERTRDSDEPVCAFMDIYEPEAGFWVKRIDPNPPRRTVAAGFDATIPWPILGVDGVVNLQDLALLTEVGISIPARAYQVGVEEFHLAFYGETFSYEVNLSDHGLEALHELASVQHTLTTKYKPMPLGTSFGGVQLLEMFRGEMRPQRKEKKTKGESDRFMMGLLALSGRSVSFYPKMPSGFMKSPESKQYTFSITIPGKIDSKVEIAEVQKQLRADPSNPKHYVRLAALYSYEGRLTDAVKISQAALDSGVTSVDIHVLMAEALLGFGRHQDALSQAEKAVTLAPESAPAENILGTCLAALDRNEEALAHFQAAARLESLNARYHADLARAYSRVQKYDQAIVAYQETLRLDDTDARNQLMLGLMLDEYGDETMAKAHLEAAVRIEPKSPEAISSLGRYYARRKEHPTAIEYLQRAVNIEPNPKYYELLGVSYADLNRWAEAENAFREAAELDPTNGSLVLNLGACLANTGKLDEALDKFEQACRIDPSDAIAQQYTEQLSVHLSRNK